MSIRKNSRQRGSGDTDARVAGKTVEEKNKFVCQEDDDNLSVSKAEKHILRDGGKGVMLSRGREGDFITDALSVSEDKEAKRAIISKSEGIRAWECAFQGSRDNGKTPVGLRNWARGMDMNAREG